jgi:hypothetical protein
MLLRENPVQERSLSRTEESGENGDWDAIGLGHK